MNPPIPIGTVVMHTYKANDDDTRPVGIILDYRMGNFYNEYEIVFPSHRKTVLWQTWIKDYFFDQDVLRVVK